MEKALQNYIEAVDYKKPSERKVSENYVFDENRSVKWNREQVLLHNERCEQAKENWRAERNYLIRKAVDKILEAIQETSDYNMSKEEAKLIWGWFNQNFWSDDCVSMVYVLYELIELADNLHSVNCGR